MYDKFTERARHVMLHAKEEARRFGHEYIGTEHILLGIAKEGTGVAAHVLKSLDVDLKKIRKEVEKMVQSGPSPAPSGRQQPPFTPRAKKVLELSMEEARNIGHNYVGTEHLLLGLLRENDGIAAQVLLNMGLKLETVREEVLEFLGTELTEVGEKAPGAMARSKRAGKAMTCAEKEAERLNHDYIGTEHILLGIVREGTGVAVHVLKGLGVDPANISAEVEKLVKAGSASGSLRRRQRRPYTPRALKALELSSEEARALGHDYVGTEHLLLGLLREDDGPAGQVLRNMGLTLEGVREAI